MRNRSFHMLFAQYKLLNYYYYYVFFHRTSIGVDHIQSGENYIYLQEKANSMRRFCCFNNYNPGSLMV